MRRVRKRIVTKLKGARRDMSLLESAEELEVKGDYLGSLELVFKFLESEPNDVRALELKASLCLIKDREPEAIRTYESLFQYYGSDDYVWKQLFILRTICSAYWRLKSSDKAIICCEKSIAICERFLKIDDPYKNSFVEELFGMLWLLGEYQYKSRKYSGAVDTYKKMLGLNLKFGCLETIADTLYELACSYRKLNDTNEALSKYSEALKIYDALENDVSTFDCRSKVHYSIGTIRFGAREYEKALFHVKKCTLYIERVYGQINDSGDVEDNSIYKKARRLQKSLEKNKFLWKK